MKTISVIYEGSSGRRYDLKTSPLHIKKANFHDYAWTRETVGLQYGERLVAFGKRSKTYQVTLYLDQDPEMLRDLHKDFERDIVTMRPGRIIWNKDYIPCYIVAGSTYPTVGNAYIANEVSIYCPSPMWLHEDHFSLQKAEADESGFLDYPYDYSYDYTYPNFSTRYLWDDFYGRVSIRAVISGPTVNPAIVVCGKTFGANLTLAEGEQLVIDTRPTALIGEQVYRISVGTQRTNVFNLRNGDISPLTCQGAGTVYWSQTFTVDLTTYRERSEPAWI